MTINRKRTGNVNFRKFQTYRVGSFRPLERVKEENFFRPNYRIESKMVREYIDKIRKY